jgi:hypothetical protein
VRQSTTRARVRTFSVSQRWRLSRSEEVLSAAVPLDARSRRLAFLAPARLATTKPSATPSAAAAR